MSSDMSSTTEGRFAGCVAGRRASHKTACGAKEAGVMNERLSAVVQELYADGIVHDAAQPDRLLKRRNLEPATSELLSLMVRIGCARQVVEIGTANGHSTIWLADAVADT